MGGKPDGVNDTLHFFVSKLLDVLVNEGEERLEKKMCAKCDESALFY